MFLNLFQNQYFYLSFLPITTLSIGFWILLFDRTDNKKEPLILLCLALGAGILSAIIFGYIATKIELKNFYLTILGEEFFKGLLAIVAMEILKYRFKTISSGVIYGFAVGLGFAFMENLLYLTEQYNNSGFTPEFWLLFQGRFWSTTLLHGVTTATFGLFYAGAYLSNTVKKTRRESPLRVFFIPPNWYQFRQIISLHITRYHLLLKNNQSLKGHFSRSVIMEGFLLTFLIHFLFNLAILRFSSIAFFIALGGTWFLSWKVKKLEQ